MNSAYNTDGIIHKLVTVFAAHCFLIGKLLSAAPGYAPLHVGEYCNRDKFSGFGIVCTAIAAPVPVTNFATGINLQQLLSYLFSHCACMLVSVYREGKNRAVLRSLGWYQDLIIKRKILLQPTFIQHRLRIIPPDR